MARMLFSKPRMSGRTSLRLGVTSALLMVRGKNWDSSEDMFLVRSVIHVSHDLTVGADQKSKVYWYRVHREFLSFVKDSARTACGIMNRWKAIQASINKFCGFFTTVSETEHDVGH